MRNCICGAFMAALVLFVAGPARSEDAKDAKAVLDKAIKALGGEEKLTKALNGSTWKTKGTINFGGEAREGYAAVMLDRFRQSNQRLGHVRSAPGRYFGL